MIDCVNLRERFGHTYRIDHDPAFFAEHGPHGRAHEPFLMTIPCMHGEIYSHGGELLAVATKRRGGISRTIAASPGVTVVQDADDGITATFHVDLFDEIAAIVRPKRRRYLTAEHKAKLLAASKPFPKRHVSNPVPSNESRVPTPDLVQSAAPTIESVLASESPITRPEQCRERLTKFPPTPTSKNW